MGNIRRGDYKAYPYSRSKYWESVVYCLNYWSNCHCIVVKWWFLTKYSIVICYLKSLILSSLNKYQLSHQQRSSICSSIYSFNVWIILLLDRCCHKTTSIFTNSSSSCNCKYKFTSKFNILLVLIEKINITIYS